MQELEHVDPEEDVESGELVETDSNPVDPDPAEQVNLALFVTLEEAERFQELMISLEDAELRLAKVQIEFKEAQLNCNRFSSRMARVYGLREGDEIQPNGQITRNPAAER